MNVLEPTEPGLTPKGHRVPETAEEFAYLAELYEQAMLKQFRENNKLLIKINKLEQRIQKQSRRLASFIQEKESTDET
jgi:hypothetical protein